MKNNHSSWRIIPSAMFTTQLTAGSMNNPPHYGGNHRTISKLKNNKAEGIDRIPAELSKAAPEVTADSMKPILEQIWNTASITQEWKKGIIVKLPQKGDLTECCN